MITEKNTHQELSLIIEALLLAAGKPMTLSEIANIFEEYERPDKPDILAAIKLLQLQNEYRGVELIEVALGFQYQSKQTYAHLIAKLWQEKPGKYSRALLETLALIAYRQPITRGEIEQVRGVALSSSIFK